MMKLVQSLSFLSVLGLLIHIGNAKEDLVDLPVDKLTYLNNVKLQKDLSN